MFTAQAVVNLKEALGSRLISIALKDEVNKNVVMQHERGNRRWFRYPHPPKLCP